MPAPDQDDRRPDTDSQTPSSATTAPADRDRLGQRWPRRCKRAHTARYPGRSHDEDERRSDRAVFPGSLAGDRCIDERHRHRGGRHHGDHHHGPHHQPDAELRGRPGLRCDHRLHRVNHGMVSQAGWHRPRPEDEVHPCGGRDPTEAGENRAAIMTAFPYRRPRHRRRRDSIDARQRITPSWFMCRTLNWP